jgi:hypothetical protein
MTNPIALSVGVLELPVLHLAAKTNSNLIVNTVAGHVAWQVQPLNLLLLRQHRLRLVLAVRQ